MKYITLTLALLTSIHAMDTTHLHYLPDTPHLPLISKNYTMAQQAIAHKNNDILAKIAPELTEKEQIQLYQLAQYELDNAPSTLKLLTKNGLRFCWGLGITAAGSLHFLLNYASSTVNSICENKCGIIAKELYVRDGSQLCDTLCSTISQNKLHELAVYAGTTTTTSGMALSTYSVYSLVTELKNKNRLRSMITLLQTSNHYSDDDTEDSDSTEIV